MKNICLFFILACFFPLAAQAEQPLKNNEAFVVAKAANWDAATLIQRAD